MPLWSSCMLSWAKVEKVVKPPHTPVVSSMHRLLFVEPFLANRANNTPKTKQPTTLTASVPHGNPGPQVFFITVEI